MTRQLDLTIREISDLADCIRSEKKTLLSHWKKEVKRLPSAKSLETPILEDHIPLLLDELAEALNSTAEFPISTVDIVPEDSPQIHGLERSKLGYDIVEVVSEYKIMRSCIYELIWKKKLVAHEKAYQVLNRIFDNAIALAVQSYATNQALKVQQLREEYLAYLAHDLRSPMNAISMVIYTMLYQAAEEKYSPKTLEMLEILNRNSQFAIELVENILKENIDVKALSSISLERKTFMAKPLIDSLIIDLKPIAETNGIKITNQVGKTLRVFADPGLIKRVFENLMVNALKYSPRGEIVISARMKDPGGVEFRVKDTGCGIAKERLENIFDKYAKADQKDGSGLGLSIVKAYVEAHGGKAEVESIEGDGSIFKFTIPMK